MSDHGRGEHSGHDVGETPPHSGEREVPPPHIVQLIPDSKLPVLLSLDLAQRILAALEEAYGFVPMAGAELKALASELREKMPR